MLNRPIRPIAFTSLLACAVLADSAPCSQAATVLIDFRQIGPGDDHVSRQHLEQCRGYASR